MANWQAIVGGVTYNLSDRNPFDVVSITGVGIAPTRRLTQRGPLQHGETDIGFRLDPRNVNLVLAIKGINRSATDSARQQLAYIFGARQSGAVQLRCTRDDGMVRQLDCRAVGIVDTPITDSERIWDFQRVGVQLVASDPNWYDPVTGSFVAGGLVGSSGWSVPLEVPFVVANPGIINETVSINYSGTFDDYPIITIRGALEDPVISNLTTGDVLDFTGAVIGVNEYWIVDLRYGHKTVIDHAEVNKIAELSSSSDLATWRLVSMLETGDGVNTIRCEASSSGSGASISILYTNRFVSL